MAGFSKYLREQTMRAQGLVAGGAPLVAASGYQPSIVSAGARTIRRKLLFFHQPAELLRKEMGLNSGSTSSALCAHYSRAIPGCEHQGIWGVGVCLSFARCEKIKTGRSVQIERPVSARHRWCPAGHLPSNTHFSETIARRVRRRPVFHGHPDAESRLQFPQLHRHPPARAALPEAVSSLLSSPSIIFPQMRRHRIRGGHILARFRRLTSRAISNRTE